MCYFIISSEIKDGSTFFRFHILCAIYQCIISYPALLINNDTYRQLSLSIIQLIFAFITVFQIAIAD